MNKKVIVFLLFYTLNCTQSYACNISKDFLDNPDPTMDCDEDIKNFAEKVSECRHWAGEDAYNKERGKQISRAINKLHCDRIEKDGESLLKVYDTKPDTQNIIKSILKIWAE